MHRHALSGNRMRASCITSLPSLETGAAFAPRGVGAFMIGVRPSFSRSLPLIAAFLARALILLAPAIWNRFPFLFFDTGAYLERPFDGTLSAGRSMVYGTWIALLRFHDFWPAAILQCLMTVWVIYLVLRTHGLRGRAIALPLS